MELNYETLVAGLQSLFYGKNEGEGIRQVIGITCWKQEQVDAVVERVGGWKNLATLIENKEVILSITSDQEDNPLQQYVKACLLEVDARTRSANYAPIGTLDIMKEIRELEKQFIYVYSEYQSLGSDEWEFGYVIVYLPKEHENDKRRAPHIKRIESFSFSGGATYSGAWPTIEESLIEGIKHAKTIVR